MFFIELTDGDGKPYLLELQIDGNESDEEWSQLMGSHRVIFMIPPDTYSLLDKIREK